ncbi:AraC family transcriptional regulator [Asticcacaulis sp. 201]|uniref:helix-turn-helix domain-containing protein n=1 Tax=Asticcacaulis sp. 201 TaxID=3028787 RepID=UPI002916CBDE|nr:AraC family transcriptional regulator [Asticcacaulis sp. 201]MDV6330937.1 AraC family transcriptional regulator [Asticcacaulis sp. 201]
MNTVFSSIRIGRYAPDLIMDAHVHDEVSFSLVLAGGYEETIRGRSETHVAGTLLVCPSDEPHAQRFGRGGLYKLVFDPTPETVARVEDMTRLADAPILRSLAVADVGRRILSELQRDDTFSPLVIEGLSLELIGQFARGHATGAGSAPRYLKAAMEYMREAETASLRLADVALAVGCDPAKLSTTFQHHLGCTLGEYQRRMRVERAAALLATGRLPISEIALMCGFSDQPHLNRAFKAQIGTSPAAYRRSQS